MAHATPSLDELIQSVQRSAPDDPLEQLAQASRLKDELAERADSLLGHFVDQARRAGHSWSQIGDALGVSKQAAQQRHTARDPLSLERVTPRTRLALDEAQAAATRLEHNFIGTEHLLLGILAVPECLAAKILAEAGMTAGSAETAVRELVSPGAGAGAGVPYTPRAARAMARAVVEALELGHNYIGTEHLLLALFSEDEGVAARLLRDAGLTRQGVLERVIQLLTTGR
jgi:hypothetical protein